MDSALKQRLIGAAVLVALAMIFLPMLLQGPDGSEPDAAQVPMALPAAPDQDFETRELPLAVPAPVSAEDGVLGMDTTPPAVDDPNAVATVDQMGEPAARTEFDPATAAPAATPSADAGPVAANGAVAAVDAATGLPLPSPAAPAQAVPGPAPTTAASAATPPAQQAPPAPVPATSPLPLPASVAGGRYAVNVGSFSNLDNARALADRLRSSGLPLTSESVDVAGKPAMRLRVGPYGDRTAAEAARLRVESVTGGSANVVALDAAAARPAAAAAPVRASTAAGVGFAVQLGALSSEADANALRDRARAAGFVAFHQRVDTDRGPVWRVRVGPEADRAAAERLRTAVGTQLGLKDAIIVSHP